MDNKALDRLNEIADEFGAIAKKVNESSQERKNHSEEAIKFIKKSLELGEILNNDVMQISEINKELRDQDNSVFNTCLLLKTIIDKQKVLLQSLLGEKIISEELVDEINEITDIFQESLNKALDIVQEVIVADNDIILMDDLIVTRKKFQRDCIQQLKELAFRSLEDAENAIKGSSSNLDRGLAMVERLKNVESLISEKNNYEIESLIKEAHEGWKIAEKVNKSSSSQLEFTEKVNLFTEQLHEDSIGIKNLVVEKHELFKNNLERITILTVILSLEFKTFLETKDIIDKIDMAQHYSIENRNNLINLISYMNIASNKIEHLASLNYDMTDRIHINADLESKSVELTSVELNYYESIKTEVNAMTEATRYPIEGSSQNIKNGQELENILKDLAKTIS